MFDYTDIHSVSAGLVGPVGPPLPLPLPVVPPVGPPIHIPGGNHLGMMYTCCYDIQSIIRLQKILHHLQPFIFYRE